MANNNDSVAATKELMFCRNQDAPRNYTQVMLCFAVDDAMLALSHLKLSVKFLQDNYTFFSARLGPGADTCRLYLSTSPSYQLLFVGSGYGTTISYEALRSGSFATERLSEIFARDDEQIHNYTNPASEHRPATLVHGVALDKGLLIRLYVHHALFDGHMRNHFIDCLAAATRGKTLKSPSRTSFPFDYDSSQSFQERLGACPELVLLPEPTNPRAPRLLPAGVPHDDIKKTSRVFVLSEAKVKALQELIHAELAAAFHPQDGDDDDDDEPPLALFSTYVCISALTFAHVVRARLGGEAWDYLPRHAHACEATLRHEVDFRRRAFGAQHRHHMDDYFGNATVSVFTRVAPSLAVEAAGATITHDGRLGLGLGLGLDDDDDDAFRLRQRKKRLAELARTIQRSLDAVDEDYVRARLAVAATVPDPRRLGLDYDPRQPQVLGFNSWRHTGGREAWGFPPSSTTTTTGSEQQRPEAFRLARGYSMRNALILPQRHGSRDQEILVSLSEVAMDKLLEDEHWLS